MLPQFTLSKFVWCLTSLVCLTAALVATGLDSSALHAQDVNDSKSEISLGLNGKLRLGKWAPVFIKFNGQGLPSKFEIETLDGDDTPIVFAGRLLQASQPNSFQAWIRLGRKYGNITVRILDDADKLLEQQEFPLSSAGKISQTFKSTSRIIATLEPELIFKSALESNSTIGGGRNAATISALNSESQMPFHWVGYEGAETLVLVTSDLDRIKSFSATQVSAIKAWVENGGRLVLSVAQHSEQLMAEGGLLASFNPGTYSGPGKTLTSYQLESFADSSEQLIPDLGEPILTSTFSDIRGEVDLKDRKQKPLIIRTAVGLGEVIFVCIDLDSERITNWAGFNKLVAKLASAASVKGEGASGQQSVKGTSVSTFGYEDLVGQLRVPLDSFSKVHFIAFTWIAILIALYILCIGPGDFFFLKRLLGKMELTWITFPLLALLFCGLAFGITKMTRPNTIQLNQLELIDVDTINGRARGSVWSNIYSPHGGTCTIEFDPKHNLGFELDSELLSWHGLPGDGLGGMWSDSTPGLIKTAYRQTIDIKDNQQLDTSIVELPLQVSSTKPMFGQWWSKNSLNVRSSLSSIKGKSDSLRGRFKNPFDSRLKNCRLLYGGWAYELNGPLDGNDTFDLLTGDQVIKNLGGSLRRKVKKSKESNRSNNTAWNPTDTKIDRIATMMMFYQAAGGSNYTGLTNDYQSSIDMSNNLIPSQAILIGEIEKPGVEMLIDGQRTSENYDETVTLVRILLPVKIK